MWGNVCLSYSTLVGAPVWRICPYVTPRTPPRQAPSWPRPLMILLLFVAPPPHLCWPPQPSTTPHSALLLPYASEQTLDKRRQRLPNRLHRRSGRLALACPRNTARPCAPFPSASMALVRELVWLILPCLSCGVRAALFVQHPCFPCVFPLLFPFAFPLEYTTA